MIPGWDIFDRRNRGILLDIVVFFFSLILISVLARFSTSLITEGQTSAQAKIAIGLFLVALFFLQPLGPILKRWSFHQRYKSFDLDGTEITTGRLLFFYKFFYIAIMVVIFYLAYSYFKEAFTDLATDRAETVVLVAAVIMSLVNVRVILSYFRPPEKEPRWKFLTTPQAELLGDLCLFLNVICFQVVWITYTSSPHFLNLLHKITYADSKNVLDGLAGRLYITSIAALLVYFPPRIFYLAADRHRRITWLTMLLANLPLIMSIVFYAPAASSPRALKAPDFTVTPQEIHGEYKLDYQAGMKKYLGKYVNITGRVESVFIPRSLELDAEVGLDGKGGYPLVHCGFDEDQISTVKALRKDQIVTLQCVGADYWGSGPKLKHCVLATAQW